MHSRNSVNTTNPLIRSCKVVDLDSALPIQQNLVLHHQPPNIGLKLDEGGWADVDELLAALPLVGAEWQSFA
jgi:hypothetical protein